MPYYIDPEGKQVFITIGSSDTNTMTKDMEPIDGEVARNLQLRHHQPLNEAQITALRQGSIDRFMAASSSTSRAGSTQTQRNTSPSASATNSRRMPAAVTRAANSAAIVEGFSWVVLVIFWIAGIALATQTRNSGFGSSDHPYVFIGLGLAIGGSINCLMIIMVAAYIKAKMELARLER